MIVGLKGNPILSSFSRVKGVVAQTAQNTKLKEMEKERCAYTCVGLEAHDLLY